MENRVIKNIILIIIFMFVVSVLNTKVAHENNIVTYEVDNLEENLKLGDDFSNNSIVKNEIIPEYKDIKEEVLECIGDNTENFSLIYYNLATEESIFINEDMEFTAASLYKVGLNLVCYDMVSKGEISLDDLVYYNDEQYQGGTGILQYEENLNSYLLSDLLDYSIIYSDNIASTMVYDYIGGWNNYKFKLFSLLNIQDGNYKNVTTANIEFKTLKYIYDNRDNEYISHLIEVMKKTEFHNGIDRYLPYENVAHKIGYDEEYTHDIGIVYCDKPFILICLSNNVINAEDISSKIAKILYKYNS